MTVEERITSLERRCRTLMPCLTGLVVLGGTIFLMGAAGPKKPEALTARELNIVDEKGEVRIRLHGKKKDGHEYFSLTMYDKDGEGTVHLHDIAQINVRKGEGITGLMAGASGGSFYTNGPQNTPSVSLGVTDERATFLIRDRSGETMHRFQTDPKVAKKDMSNPFK